MTVANDPSSLQVLHQAQEALRQGDRHAARRLAAEAARLLPDREEPWLILAACASPQASIGYLQRALQINPQSTRARKGLEWATLRLEEQRHTDEEHAQTRPLASSFQLAAAIPAARKTHKSAVRLILPLSALVFFLVVGAFFLSLGGFDALTVQAGAAAAMRPENLVLKPSLTPTITPTFTPTSTFTPTPTPTNTPTPTATFTPTSTPTNTPVPTDTPVPTAVPAVDLPAGVGESDRWIDIDLSDQLTYAYEGRELKRTFVVSTGTWLHPTVLGTYNIYIMLRYDDMAGPGYYLPDVPYTMYFYRGYALHGTYWHSNFGTPMSHGCVNLQTSDAEWIFNFVSVGTVVNVHN